MCVCLQMPSEVSTAPLPLGECAGLMHGEKGGWWSSYSVPSNPHLFLLAFLNHFSAIFVEAQF